MKAKLLHSDKELQESPSLLVQYWPKHGLKKLKLNNSERQDVLCSRELRFLCLRIFKKEKEKLSCRHGLGWQEVGRARVHSAVETLGKPL